MNYYVLVNSEVKSVCSSYEEAKSERDFWRSKKLSSNISAEPIHINPTLSLRQITHAF